MHLKSIIFAATVVVSAAAAQSALAQAAGGGGANGGGTGGGSGSSGAGAAQPSHFTAGVPSIRFEDPNGTIQRPRRPTDSTLCALGKQTSGRMDCQRH